MLTVIDRIVVVADFANCRATGTTLVGLPPLPGVRDSNPGAPLASAASQRLRITFVIIICMFLIRLFAFRLHFYHPLICNHHLISVGILIYQYSTRCMSPQSEYQLRLNLSRFRLSLDSPPIN
jgi:hypothetical protein